MTAPAALRTLSVRLPLPPSQLSPNARVDRRGVSGIRSRYGIACKAQIAAAMGDSFGPPMQRARMTLHFAYCHGQTPMDQDNAVAAAKRGLDQLAAAGAIVSDAPQHLSIERVITTRHLKPCWCDGGLVVRLTEVLS